MIGDKPESSVPISLLSNDRSWLDLRMHNHLYVDFIIPLMTWLVEITALFMQSPHFRAP